MKKAIIISLIAVAAIIGLWVAARLTGALQFYTVPTMANYPSIKPGDKIFASKLVKPQRFDFICYRIETPQGSQIWTHRLCGLEGDTLEIINGCLYINGYSVDSSLSLAHYYTLPEGELAKIREAKELYDESDVIAVPPDSLWVCLSDKAVQKLSLNAKRDIVPKGKEDFIIANIYSEAWNADNFGPIAIPKGKYFLLGDNRSNSFDSRYSGLTDKSAFVGTIAFEKAIPTRHFVCIGLNRVYELTEGK